MQRIGIAMFCMCALLAGCGAGAPGCSDSETLEAVSEVIDYQAKIVGLSLVQPLAMVAFGEDMRAVSLAAQGRNKEAFELLEAAVNRAADKNPDNETYRQTQVMLAAARETRVELSGASTVSETERAVSCRVTSKITFGVPSGEMLGTDQWDKIFASVGDVTAQRNFEAYYADDGTLHVEVAPAE
jgi:hypothetical protein